MNKKFITFGDIEIEKRKSYYLKHSINMKNIEIDKIIISNKVAFAKNGFKYSIDYKDDEEVKPLCIMHSKPCGYTKSFDETKYMSF